MALCNNCGEDNPAGAQFCLACGQPLARVAELPPELRKTVTVVFCDVVGSTSLAERLDSESFRRVMWHFFEAMRSELKRHGGRVEKFIGDAVLAVFGIPTLHEDDALRAVRAAGGMRDALPSLNEELERRWGARLQTRTGVNTGEVVAGDPSRGETLVVVGDIVNVAARLEQVAAPGEILLGASTYSLVCDAVEVEALEPLPLKGKAIPIPAFRLVEVREAATGRARRLASPIIGRHRELALLDAAFQRCVVERSCRIVTVLGQAGVGKSRLTHEFTTALGKRAAVVHGRCLPYGDGITFWPVAGIVKEAARIGEGDSRARARTKIDALLSGDADATLIAERLAGAVGLSETASDADETYWAIRRLLEILATDRPLVVVLDDIQWGEDTFLNLVEHLAGASSHGPILLLCMTRPELRESRPALVRGGGSVTAVALEPLSEDDSQLLIANLLDGAVLADEIRHRVTLTAEGNPLFLEELLRMLVDDGLVQQHDGRWRAAGPLRSLSVPPTVEALLGARLDRLQEEERAIIERAAVIGREFWVDAVAELSPEPTKASLGRILQTLVRKQLLRRVDRRVAGPEAFRFTHILIRDVAYARLLKASRSELHERFAKWLERWADDRVGEYEEILGYHLEQAYGYRRALAPLDEQGRRLGHRAGRHLAAAGRRALARGDMSAAASLLDRASGLLGEEPERIESLLDLTTALSEAGALTRADDVVSVLIAVTASTGDRRLEQHSTLARAWLQTLIDPSLDADEMVQVAEHAIAVFAPLGDEVGLARAWHLIGQAHFTACRCAASTDALERALVHARRARDRGSEAEILLGILTSCYFGPIATPNAILRCEEILRQASGRQRIEASALNALAGLHAMCARFPEARRLYARGRVIGSNFGAKVGMAAMALYSGDVEMLAANDRAAERDLRWGHDLLVEIGETGLLSTLTAQLAEAIYAQGRAEEAERLTEESVAAAAQGDVFSQVAWRTTRAKAVAERGQLSQAEELAREAVRLAEHGDALNLRADATMALAQVLAATERQDETTKAYEAALRLYERKGNLVSAAKARTALAGMAQPTGSSRLSEVS